MLRGALPCTDAPLPCAGDLYSYSATKLFGRHPCSQLVSVTCGRMRVLVRLSHPRPPDRDQHGCTVGVPAGTHPCAPDAQAVWASVAERQPRAVLSCAALWCLVVHRPRRRVDCLVLTLCYVSSRKNKCKFVERPVRQQPPHLSKSP